MIRILCLTILSTASMQSENVMIEAERHFKVLIEEKRAELFRKYKVALEKIDNFVPLLDKEISEFNRTMIDKFLTQQSIARKIRRLTRNAANLNLTVCEKMMIELKPIQLDIWDLISRAAKICIGYQLERYTMYREKILRDWNFTTIYLDQLLKCNSDNNHSGHNCIDMVEEKLLTISLEAEESFVLNVANTEEIVNATKNFLDQCAMSKDIMALLRYFISIKECIQQENMSSATVAIYFSHSGREQLLLGIEEQRRMIDTSMDDHVSRTQFLMDKLYTIIEHFNRTVMDKILVPLGKNARVELIGNDTVTDFTICKQKVEDLEQLELMAMNQTNACIREKLLEGNPFFENIKRAWYGYEDHFDDLMKKCICDNDNHCDEFEGCIAMIKKEFEATLGNANHYFIIQITEIEKIVANAEKSFLDCDNSGAILYVLGELHNAFVYAQQCIQNQKSRRMEAPDSE